MSNVIQASTLFRPQADKEFTQLTFALKFFPMHALSRSRRQLVIFNRFQWMTKSQIEELCNEEKNVLIYQTSAGDDEYKSRWNIVWANNNMPSAADWKSTPESRKIFIEFRVTRQWGRVAILSFSSFAAVLEPHND